MAENLTTLRRQRGTCKARLTQLETFLARFHESGEPLETLQMKIEFVQDAWAQFEKIQERIEVLDENDVERSSIEDRYCSIIGRARALVRSLERSAGDNINHSENDVNNQRLQVKLPTMNLPMFDGHPEKWLEFRDSFQGLIDTNRDLTNIQRMYYLKSCLKGRAAEVIQSLESSAENYTIAWNLLTKRFEDKRAIASRHLQLLLDIPVMQKESGVQLRQTLDGILRHIRALEFLKVNTWDTVITHLMIAKFDSVTRREWRTHIKDKEITVESLTDFLEERCLIVEPETNRAGVGKVQSNKSMSQQRKSDNLAAFASTSKTIRSTQKCTFCNEESHSMYACSKFKDLTVPQRLNAVNERKLCRNCLRTNHFAQVCQSSTCKRCNAKHYTLLHPNEQPERTANTSKVDVSNVSLESGEQHNSSVNCSSVNIPGQSKVLLSTARIWIYDSSGTAHDCRVLLDSASQSNFLSKELCNRLRLTTQRYNCSVGGLAASIHLTESTHTVIQSKHTAYRTKIKFLIVERLIDKLPLSDLDVTHLQIPNNIRLADDKFFASAKVDAILGVSVFWSLLCIGQVKLGRFQPVLQKTHLGWIVAGDVAVKEQNSSSICCFSAEAQIRDQIEKFWRIEEIEQLPLVSKDEEACETHFLQTYQQNESGRFTVSFPFKCHPEELGESRSNALKCLNKLEHRFKKDSKLQEDYVAFMEEYIKLDHMTAVKANEDEASLVNYIPHHPVVTSVNGRRKLRVVFDASAKTSSGKSLNDILLVGPTIQQTLFSIILRFRQHQYVLTADIIKMYRQVNINEEQRDVQRILWRTSEDEPVQEYTLNTVTYGVSSAPFLAIRSLYQAAHNACFSHPDASQLISRDFYVDDLLTGHDDLDRLRTLKHEITKVLSSSGFELSKWRSNEPTLFEPDTEDFVRIATGGEEAKTLGLTWASNRDTIQYQVTTCRANHNVTKRTVLSTVSQIFDPLGLVGPATIKAKIILQKLWQLNLGWDESLPLDLHHKWTTYVDELNCLNDIIVPRVIICQDPVIVEIHGFSDASESAYGACVYLRSVNREGEVIIRLVCAKSRVAPLKTICIPRLELCGSLLLSKLTNSVARALTIPLNHQYYWCDSAIVLAWIRGEPHIRKTFVANRLTEIHQLTSREQWHHVKSEHNPADVISRGINPNQLRDLRLWWQGPEWLQQPEEYIHQPIPSPIGEVPETKPIMVLATQVREATSILERYSSLSKLKRVIAYCLRWKGYQRSAATPPNSTLTVNELDHAMMIIMRLVQEERFVKEIQKLQVRQQVNPDSPLLTLHPFLDRDGLIRVGGRLRNAQVSYSRRYPIVLPGDHCITTLIIREAHYRSLHSGVQTLIANLRESFWILSAKATVRKVLHRCIVCYRSRPVPAQQLMGDLPENHVTGHRAFLNVGLDYGGPFRLKLSRNKTCKAYICLFICMSTKAIHLELVSDLSTPAFLNALKRFVARRGKCVNIYSDNGTNFEGANHELRILYEFLTQQSHQSAIDYFCTEQAIQWHFIPPYSPHMGGLWEAGIKSVKLHLRRILSEALLTYEELYTVLTQVEAVLNSRPLTPISDDPTDLVALTPGHFLIGESLTSIPDKDWSEVAVNRLTRFQYLAKLTQQFWKRWSTEYLSNLHQRYKWNREDRSTVVENGTMVILRDENTPSMHWPLGRIVEGHAGRDGKVRVVSVKTAQGIKRRALAKICILPIERSH